MPTLELSLKPDAVVNPWSPWAIPNLSGFFHFTEGNCFVSNPGAATAIDGVVGYVPSLFGGSLTASEATNKPTLKADGLQFATMSDQLVLSSPFVLGAGTIYMSVKVPSANLLLMLGHDTGAAYLACSGGVFAGEADGAGSGLAAAVSDDTVSLLRLDQVNDAGLIRLFVSGTPGEASNATGVGPFTFNRIGLSSVSGSEDAGRLRAVILINRHIAYDSPEDVRIRNWIAANDGAAL